MARRRGFSCLKEESSGFTARKDGVRDGGVSLTITTIAIYLMGVGATRQLTQTHFL
jgi:hypothetical protein